MKSLFHKPETKLFSKITVILSLLFLFFLSINYYYISWISKERIKNTLLKNLEHIGSDLKYQKGKWDTSFYFQDSTTAVDKPLYILTKEGFVIERMNPITGFLDTAQFNYSNSFNQPQTITTPANTTWRVVSKPVLRNEATIAAIMTAYFDPNPQILSDIDEELISTAKKIDNLIELKNNKIYSQRVEPKIIPYSIYYEVVDQFNRVLAEDGGPPTFIDRSFVAKELLSSTPREIKNDQTGEPFLILSKPILDSKKNPIGVIVAGESLKDLNAILIGQRNFSLVSGSATLILTFLLLLKIFGQDLKKMLEAKINEALTETNKTKFINPKRIAFDKKYSCIVLDEETIPIEYGSKQFDLCKTLFSSPQKRFEHDELLERNKLSDEEIGKRTFYDAVLRINNKIEPILGVKLIIYKDKTYHINSNLLSKIKKTT